MLAGVDVAVLGPLTVRDGDTTIEIPAAKERAILALLALAVPRSVRANALIDALWGERPPSTAAKTLQNYVARLRRALPPGVIASQAGGYRLCVEPEAVDAHRFERAVAAGRAAARGGDAETARGELAAALTIWRDPVAPDLTDDHAARLAELARSAADDLAAARLALGEDETLVVELDAAARAEPLRERRWAQLMLALYRAGRQADALRTYQRARRALVEGHGLEPGEELRRLQAAVIAQDPALHLGRAERASSRSNLPAAVAAVSAPAMVGREEEVGRIDEAWTAARAGLTRAVVISGEAGIGKTRLLAEVARRAHRDGALVLFGRCDPEPLVPYEPFVEALRWYMTTTPAGALRAGLGWEGDELARLVPSLAGRLGRDVPTAPSGIDARHRLFEAVVAFLDARASERPLLLALDDVQWADAGTRLLLRHVLRALPEARLLAVATHRATGDGDGDLAALLAGLPPEVAPLTVALGGLDGDDIAALLGPVGDEVAAAVARAAGGSPLFVTQIVDQVRTTGRVPRSDELPEGLHQAVARRLRPFDATARLLLEAAAVIGLTFDVHVAGAAAGLGAADATAAADAAARAGVLQQRPAEPGRAAFAHDLLRAAVYDELPAGRRISLHRSVGDALAAEPAPDPGAVAHHYVAAAAGRRDAAAARWSAAAGRAALDQLAWEMAGEHLASAIEHLSDPGGADHVQLLIDLGRARRAAGSASDAKTHFTAAIAVARAAADPAAQAEAALAWAEVPVDVRRELGEVIAVLRDAATANHAASPSLRARILGRLAFSLAWQHAADARATADEAIILARAAGDEATLARALVWSLPTRNPFEAGADGGPAAELSALMARTPEPALRVAAHIGDAVRHVQHARRERAIASLAAARAEADRQRLLDLDVRVTKAEGDWALADGRTADAERAVAELFDVAGRHETRNAALFAGALLYGLRRSQGRLAELAPWFDRIAERGERVALVPAMHVEVLIAAGRHAEAAARLDQYVATGFADVWPVEEAHSLATLAACAAAVCHRAATESLAARLAPWTGLIVWDGEGGILGAVDHHLGLVAAAGGDRIAAAGHFAIALEAHRTLGSAPLVAMTEAAMALTPTGN
jgi:DNA-binding SARP family transcriptional activator